MTEAAIERVDVRPMTYSGQYPNGVVVSCKSWMAEHFFPRLAQAAQIRDSVNYYHQEKQRAAEAACHYYTYNG